MAPRRKKARLDSDSSPVEEVEGAQKGQVDKTEDQLHRRQLFVRSLPPTTTSEGLTEHFSQSFPLKHATAVLDPTTKQCKGYGFVTFVDAEDAQLAKEQFNGTDYLEKKIKVDIAEPRHRELDGSEASGKKELQAAKAERDQERHQPPPKLIVRNLPWTIKKPEQLESLFRSYGKVKSAVIPKKNGRLAGFGFVVIRGKKNAERALEGVNGKVVDERTLAVDWAVKKDEWEELEAEHNVEAEGEGQGAMEGVDDGESDDEDRIEEESGSEVEDGSLPSLEEDEDSEDEEAEAPQKAEDHSSTLFVRNVPFTCDDELLKEHFARFGAIRYARTVMDHVIEKPKGTAFVCFFNKDDADECLRQARTTFEASSTFPLKDTSSKQPAKRSILENDLADPNGAFTLEGRLLQVSRAVDKREAARLEEAGTQSRDRRDRDKRRLFLLSEGTVPSNSPMYESLAPSEVKMRESSMKQRKALIQSNPSLHLSLTRLSIRNMPRTVTSKDLKALAREAVVGFAQEIKAGKREKLSKDELKRGGEEMAEAEKRRVKQGKGVVKQAKVVFEGREGGKVNEDTGAGRSRGYGFIEYTSHRWALMGLRWLNGHIVTSKSKAKEDQDDRKRRLIVEFAIENAQVVARRKERESKARERVESGKGLKGQQAAWKEQKREDQEQADKAKAAATKGKKRKRNAADEKDGGSSGKSTTAPTSAEKKQTRLIAKKRAEKRHARKKSKQH